MPIDLCPLYRGLIVHAAFGVLSLMLITASASDATFLRGDVDSDGLVRMNDAQKVMTWLFQGGDEPDCLDAADANDDGAVNITDAVLILNYLYQGATLAVVLFSSMRGIR